MESLKTQPFSKYSSIENLHNYLKTAVVHYSWLGARKVVVIDGKTHTLNELFKTFHSLLANEKLSNNDSTHLNVQYTLLTSRTLLYLNEIQPQSHLQKIIASICERVEKVFYNRYRVIHSDLKNFLEILHTLDISSQEWFENNLAQTIFSNETLHLTNFLSHPLTEKLFQECLDLPHADPATTAYHEAPIGTLRSYLNVIEYIYLQWQLHIGQKYKDNTVLLNENDISAKITALTHLSFRENIIQNTALIKEYIKEQFQDKTETEISNITKFIFRNSDSYTVSDEHILKSLVKTLFIDGRSFLARMIIERTFDIPTTIFAEFYPSIMPLIPDVFNKKEFIDALPPEAQNLQSLSHLIHPITDTQVLQDLSKCANTLFRYNSNLLKSCGIFIGAALITKYNSSAITTIRQNPEIFNSISEDLLASILIQTHADPENYLFSLVYYGIKPKKTYAEVKKLITEALTILEKDPNNSAIYRAL